MGGMADMLTIRTAWITRRESASPSFELYPPEAAPGETLYLTHDSAAFDDLLADAGSQVVDVLAVWRLAYAEEPREHAERLFAEGERPSAEGLWRVWKAMERRLLGFPLWALETVELLLREIGERALARLAGHLAEQVRVAGRGGGAWSETFKAAGPRAERRNLPAHEDCSPVPVERLAAHLTASGTFGRLMPGYESRPGQLEMLKAVARALNEGRHLLVEAGTGVGKSLAYLIPAAAWARLNDLPVVVSTNTRNLQAQLVEKDLPLVSEAVRAEFGAGQEGALRVALLKGRSNYLCLRQLSLLLEHGQFELERPELRLFAEAVAWSVQTVEGDLDTFAGSSHADGGFLCKLASLGDECAGRACRYFRRCFLQKARFRAASAHVVVANHALVFADMRKPGTALPPYAQVIFDEAHNLEEAATRHLSVEVTALRLGQLVRRLSRGRGKRAGGLLEVLRNHLEKGAVTADEETAKVLRRRIREIRASLETVQVRARALFTRLGGLTVGVKEAVRFRCEPGAEPQAGPPRRLVCRAGVFEPCDGVCDEALLAADRVALKEALSEAAGRLMALAEELRRAAEGELELYGDQASSVEGAASSLREFALDVDDVLAAADPEFVYWAEPAGRQAAGQANVFAAPLKIGSALAEQLYRQKASVVFCSATLRVGSSFGYVVRRLGLDQLEEGRVTTCVADSPFDYLSQCAVLAPTFLPEPSAGDGVGYAEQLAGLMLEVFAHTRGRALGLFTSYEMMNRVARLLEEPLREDGIRLLVQGASGTRDQITRVFRSGGACVLLGAHSFWEGVDVAGEALSCVVMARLPFAALGDPVFEARSEQIDAQGGSSFREFSLPQAVIRFRQGFGRLIRTRADRGVVIVADPRVVTKHYGATFRRGLPCPVLTVPGRAELLERVGALFPPGG